MEPDSIVQLVLECPKKHECYTRDIIMEDGTTTPAHLEEDK